MAGAGIGEAMLLGAAMGGGSAALAGGDPLKGALLGGLTGGIGGGIAGTGAATTGTASGALGSGLTAGTAGGTLGSGLTAGTAGGTLGSGLTAGTATAGLTPYSLAPGLSADYALASTAPSAFSNAASNAISQAAQPSFMEGLKQGAGKFINNPWESIKANKGIAGLAALSGAVGGRKSDTFEPDKYDGPLSQFRYRPEKYRRSWYGANGGIATLPVRRPMPMARGGISDLGSYSDGGRMLRGRGDGMSDSIPGIIAGRRPARLADGEFVVPADVVSHLGNGSTDAGAKQLYAMMDKVRQARTGRKAQGREINPRRFVPA